MFNLIGKTLGPYRILEQIGMGGMATVYKAYQPSMDRFVAIKVLPPQFAQDAQFTKRFQREAHAIAKLEHAHILPVYDYGEYEGITYIAMRYIEAGTLKEYMANAPLSLDEIARIIGQISSALDYAHRLGVIHRDVKPGNVLMGEQGNTYLTDFGLARIVESEQKLTGTGVGIGTPAYMSPEQGLGNKVDHRSDIYSLGVILYEMITGHVPFEAETPMAVVLKHINEPLPLPRTIKPGVPEPVELVILKALAKNPAHRYQSAGELSEALTAAIRKVDSAETPKEQHQDFLAKNVQPSWLKSPGRLAFGSLAILALVIMGVLLGQRWGKSSPPATQHPLPTVTQLLPAPTATQLLPPTAIQLPPPTATPVPLAEWPLLVVAPAISPTGLRGQLAACGNDLCVTALDGHTAKLGLEKSYTRLNGFSWSPDGSMIIFSACTQDKTEKCGDLFIAELKTGQAAQIPRRPDSPNYSLFPAWSPDGNWIAFHDAGSLALIHPDGTERHEIKSSRYCPKDIAWSPDSQRLAYTANLCDDSEAAPAFLLTVRPNGSDLRLLWNIKLDQFIALAYGPSGNLLAVRLNSGSAYWINPNCWPSSSDGCDDTFRSPLTALPEEWLPTFFPRWSKDAMPPMPDGIELGICSGEKNGQLCLWNRKTGEKTQITSDLAFEGWMGIASWSPDGQQIVFSGAKNANGSQKLYVINRDGTDLRQLTTGNTYDYEAVWSPDGEWILFHRDCSAWLIRPDGTQAHLLIERTDQYCVEGPVWSRDGQQIIWHKHYNDTTPSEIWMTRADGSNSHLVYVFPVKVDLGWHAFSPDATSITMRYELGGQWKNFLMNADGSEVHEIDWDPYWLKPDFWPPWGIEGANP